MKNYHSDGHEIYAIGKNKLIKDFGNETESFGDMLGYQVGVDMVPTEVSEYVTSTWTGPNGVKEAHIDIGKTRLTFFEQEYHESHQTGSKDYDICDIDIKEVSITIENVHSKIDLPYYGAKISEIADLLIVYYRTIEKLRPLSDSEIEKSPLFALKLKCEDNLRALKYGTTMGINFDMATYGITDTVLESLREQQRVEAYAKAFQSIPELMKYSSLGTKMLMKNDPKAFYEKARDMYIKSNSRRKIRNIKASKKANLKYLAQKDKKEVKKLKLAEAQRKREMKRMKYKSKIEQKKKSEYDNKVLREYNVNFYGKE